MGGFRQKTPHRLLKVVQDSSPGVRCQLLPCRLLPGCVLHPLGAPCLLTGSVPPRSLSLLSPLPSHSGLPSLRVPHEHRPPPSAQTAAQSPVPGLNGHHWDVPGASDPSLGGRPSSSLRPGSRPRDSPSPHGYSVLPASPPAQKAPPSLP